jgi:hypothetical protein
MSYRNPIGRRMLGAAVVCVGLGLAAAAFADDAPASTAPAEASEFTYTVIEENARIPFGADEINSFRVGRDGSLLLRAGHREWYRAVLWAPCSRDLRFEQHIAFTDRSNQAFDRFSSVVVDGNRCPIQSLDRIEDPRIAERAADAAPQSAPEAAG